MHNKDDKEVEERLCKQLGS